MVMTIVNGRRTSTHDLDLASALAVAETTDEAMRELTAYVHVAAPAAAAAGLTAPRGAGYVTRAATAPLAEAVDALQYRWGGPCVDVLGDRDPVLHLTDVAEAQHDPTARWHRFATEAVRKTPLRSLVSFRLEVESDTRIASLNVYATEANAFDATTVTALADVVTPAALALAYQAERQTRRNLETALGTSRRIGAAVGVLMARRLVTYDDAFELIRATSQNLNRKVRDVAEHVLQTGDLPAAR
jgi:hypothetical protein